MTILKESRQKRFERGSGTSVRISGTGKMNRLPTTRCVDPPGVSVTNESELRAALADPNIDAIQVVGEIVIANPVATNIVSLTVSRPVTIKGTGTNGSIVSEASSAAAETFILVNSDDVTFRNLTIKHRRTVASTNSESAVKLTAKRFMVTNVNLEFMEFGYWMEGSFLVEEGSTTYTGPLTNSGRHFGFYSITGDSTVRNLVFDFPYLENATNRFALSNQNNPSRRFNGKLTLDGVQQKRVSTSLEDPYYLNQFFVQESFTIDPAHRAGMALDIRNCKWDDRRGGAFILNNTTDPLSQYDSITLINNEQCSIGTLYDSALLATPVPRYKGLFFVDGSPGSRTLGDESVLTILNNKPASLDPRVALRAGYAYLNSAGLQPNVFVYNATAYVPST